MKAATIHLDYDGGAFLRYRNNGLAAGASNRSPVGTMHGYVTIGHRAGPASPLQRRIAAFVAAMQKRGHYEGVIALVDPDCSDSLRKEHYARFATVRRWPEERDGEEARVQRSNREAARFVSLSVPQRLDRASP